MHLRSWISVASASDPMKLAKVKGNQYTFGAEFQLPLPQAR